MPEISELLVFQKKFLSLGSQKSLGCDIFRVLWPQQRARRSQRNNTLGINHQAGIRFIRFEAVLANIYVFARKQ
jgi:hypothetical protein